MRSVVDRNVVMWGVPVLGFRVLARVVCVTQSVAARYCTTGWVTSLAKWRPEFCTTLRAIPAFF